MLVSDEIQTKSLGGEPTPLGMGAGIESCGLFTPEQCDLRLRKIVYVTHYFPYGTSETFIWPEVEEHRRAGVEVLLAPIRSAKSFHRSDPNTLAPALISTRIISAALSVAFRRPVLIFDLLKRLLSGSPSVVAKNLIVLPKGLWLGQQCVERGIEHIHAHWLSTPATAAMIASEVSSIPYSITAHRIDISQANLIPQKLKTSRFVRAIDRKGCEEISRAANELASKVVVVYLGTAVPANVQLPANDPVEEIRIATAARFVPKKGHEYLIKAIRVARDYGVIVRAELYGEGPLQPSLEQLARDQGVERQVRFPGPIRHEDLLRLLAAGDFDAAVLASLTADDGDREGIPAFLMEAMASGTPVICTNNGGIGELVREDEGIIIPERNSEALAKGLVRLAREPKLRRSLAEAARLRVASEFDVSVSAATLRQMMSGGAVAEPFKSQE